VIVVPTNYYKTPTKDLQDMGISMIIWANHNLRASVKAMQDVSADIYKNQNLLCVQNQVGGYLKLTVYSLHKIGRSILIHRKSLTPHHRLFQSRKYFVFNGIMSSLEQRRFTYLPSETFSQTYADSLNIYEEY